MLESDDQGVAYSGPLTILVDRFSASASEIFAAAMQDYGRGIVIGQETYGKGSVQNLYPLDRYALGQDPGYGQLTVTIGMYYRVTGDSTQNRGVQPDIALPSAISVEEVGESSREGSLPWNRIRSVDVQARRRVGARAAGTAARSRGAGRRRSGLPLCGRAKSRRSMQMRKEKSRLAEPGASARPSGNSRTQERLARENARQDRTGRAAAQDGRRDQGSAGRDAGRGGPDHGRPTSSSKPTLPGRRHRRAAELDEVAGRDGRGWQLVLYLTTTL